MKSKILLILLLTCSIARGQSVPNTTTFSLQDVVNVTGGTSLSAAFTNSVDAYFDVAYKGSKDNLLNFRNYTVTSACPVIGQAYLGGKVAYIYGIGDPGYVSGQCHGIIAADSDQSASAYWFDGTQKNTGATSLALGDGLSNTNLIVAAHGSGGYAAYICYSLTLNGYSDWVLPSNSELTKMKVNQVAIGGFTSTSRYWSSSEENLNNAYTWFFNTSVNYGEPKNFLGRVRAIRYF